MALLHQDGLGSLLAGIPGVGGPVAEGPVVAITVVKVLGSRTSHRAAQGRGRQGQEEQ